MLTMLTCQVSLLKNSHETTFKLGAVCLRFPRDSEGRIMNINVKKNNLHIQVKIEFPSGLTLMR